MVIKIYKLAYITFVQGKPTAHIGEGLEVPSCDFISDIKYLHNLKSLALLNCVK